MNSPGPPELIFDRALLRRRRLRYAQGAPAFLSDFALEELED